MANTPVIKKRSGSFSVAVFEETKQNKSGDSYISHSVVLQKSYKDQNGEWQRQTINLFENNVAEVALLLQATAIDLMTKKPAEPAQAEEQKQEDEPKQTESVNDEIPF